jgi:small multidrug resistance pump
MPLLLLIGAIASEVVATSALKISDGLTKLTPTIVSGIGYLLSLILLSQALKHIQVSIAYAIWSGVGTAAIAVISMTLLKEPLNAMKIIGIVLVIAGVVVLNLAGGQH